MFTVISACYVLSVPFAFIDPDFGLVKMLNSVVTGTLVAAGLVCAWLPASNQYFRAVAAAKRHPIAGPPGYPVQPPPPGYPQPYANQPYPQPPYGPGPQGPPQPPAGPR